MEYPRDSSLRGRGMMGHRSPPPPSSSSSSFASSLLSPKMDPPSSPYIPGGSPLVGGSPLSIPRSPMSPLDVMVKSEPPVSPSDYSVNYKKPRCDIDKVDWAASPGNMSLDSLSPPPPQTSNGLSCGSSMGHPSSGHHSPMSTSSYDAISPYPSKSGRDDMSPPSSLNGYSMDSFSDLKKKKGPIPRQNEELCLVCGDRASGYHYNALTCEGCKGFFRRSITKNAVYICKYGKNCEMDMYMRRKCQECRMKKCLHVGMRPECVVPEKQCQVKREQKKAREKDKSYPPVGSPIADEKLTPLSPLPLQRGLGAKPLTREQQELINTLVYYQEEYEQPSESDLKKIKFPFDGDDTSDLRFKHITEMTILTVQLIVEFSKKLPGFDTLQREDQITLLKACSSEVMMLRAARRYDSSTDSIVFGNSYPYTQESYESAGLGDSAISIFQFCRNLCKMKVDNAEYALLAAISIFSERPQLREPTKVENLQSLYLEALKAHVDNRRTPRSSVVFAKLLNVLTDLRTLGNLNAEMCFSLTLKNKILPPFLAEIWDINSYDQ